MCSACNRASLFSLFLCAVCFHTQRFTHLYPSLLPRRFPAHISVCTQDYPTFYQAVVMFMNILSMLSRPLCLHTGESDYKYTCYKKKKKNPTQSVDIDFCLLFHLVALCPLCDSSVFVPPPQDTVRWTYKGTTW